MRFKDKNGRALTATLSSNPAIVEIRYDDCLQDVVGQVSSLTDYQALDFEAEKFQIQLLRPKMVVKKTWEEFRQTGLLWWINMILHTFGWAIVIECETNAEGNVEDNVRITAAFPARVRFRGFGAVSTERGFRKVSDYIEQNATQLREEAYE